MAKNKNLILVGFMGTGKSVVGHELANRLGFEFVDTDEMIMKKAGKTISGIFAEHGEPHFRDIETATIRSLTALDGHVVSTGGGCVQRDENWTAMREAGLVVCLTARPDVIYERTRRKPHRPLLQTADPLGRIRELLERRAPFYAHADHTVDTSDLTVDEVVQGVLDAWQKGNAAP